MLNLFGTRTDEAKLHQAFAKILDNALEASPPGGRISVHSHNLDLTQPSQDRDVRLPPGTYVCVEISDTGCGIPQEHLARVFEPFFTTKRPPHRGLGLAWVYGVLSNQGGGVSLSSQPGVGTSVRLYLPADKSQIKESTAPTSDLRGEETVLIVDDEEMILGLGQQVLKAYGYKVLTANGGQKALELLSAPDTPVDLGGHGPCDAWYDRSRVGRTPRQRKSHLSHSMHQRVCAPRNPGL